MWADVPRDCRSRIRIDSSLHAVSKFLLVPNIYLVTYHGRACLLYLVSSVGA